MPTLLAVLTAAAAAVAPAGSAQEDTLDAMRRVQLQLVQRYRSSASTRPAWRTRDALGQPFDAICDADRDDVCFADDPDAGRCPNLVQCHPSPRFLLRALLEGVEAFPGSGFLTGQSVYLLGKLGRVREALDVADRCEAEDWWCAALRGYVLHGTNRQEEAEEAMRRALALAPDSVACSLHDATWVLGRWSQRGADTSVPDALERTEGWDCAKRFAVSDTIWWLADPLHGLPGNERWAEHVARALGARFHAEVRQALPASTGSESYRAHLRAERVRRGPLDSYDSRLRTQWTSRSAALYHFVPDVDPGDLSEPVWRLEAELDDEGYTPAATFLELPYQIARFRAADSLRVAAATRIAGSGLERAVDATASLVLSDGPDRAPTQIAGDPQAPVARFVAPAPSTRHVASLEVVTSRGVGWARRMLEPLAPAGGELSDPLLFELAEPEDTPPADLGSAAALMLGSTVLRADAPVGVYWETYAAPAGATLRMELAVERAAGGLVDRLRRLLPGGAEEGGGRIAWTEPASGGTHRSAVSLDLGALDGGDYTLVLRARWDGGPPLERRRPFTVD